VAKVTEIIFIRYCEESKQKNGLIKELYKSVSVTDDSRVGLTQTDALLLVAGGGNYFCLCYLQCVLGILYWLSWR